MKVLLGFANNETFLVSPETANKVKAVLPPNRYVSTSTIDDIPTPSTHAGKRSVFERTQGPSNLTPKQRQLAERMSRYLTSKQSK